MIFDLFRITLTLQNHVGKSVFFLVIVDGSETSVLGLVISSMVYPRNSLGSKRNCSSFDCVGLLALLEKIIHNLFFAPYLRCMPRMGLGTLHFASINGGDKEERLLRVGIGRSSNKPGHVEWSNRPQLFSFGKAYGWRFYRVS